MISALVKAFGQLSDPTLRRVVRLSVLGALACYAALVALVWVVLPQMRLFDADWADTGAGVVLALAALVVPLLFFPALVTSIMGVWLDDVAQAVEIRHYPALTPPRPQPWTELVGGTLRFLALTVVVNLAALPVYAVLLFTGFTVVLAIAINGYLLGREYFELVAVRRLEPAMVKLSFRNHLGRLWAAGAVIAVMFSIPLVNLVAPVVATAFMLHLSQSLRSPKDLL